MNDWTYLKYLAELLYLADLDSLLILLGSLIAISRSECKYERYLRVLVCIGGLLLLMPYFLLSVTEIDWESKAYCAFDALPFVIGGISVGLLIVYAFSSKPILNRLTRGSELNNSCFEFIRYSFAMSLVHSFILFNGFDESPTPDDVSCSVPWSQDPLKWKNLPKPAIEIPAEFPIYTVLTVFYLTFEWLMYRTLTRKIYRALDQQVQGFARWFRSAIISLAVFIPSRYVLASQYAQVRDFESDYYGLTLTLLTVLASMATIQLVYILFDTINADLSRKQDEKSRYQEDLPKYHQIQSKQ